MPLTTFQNTCIAMAAINANSTPKNFLPPPPPINSSHQLNPTVKIGQSEFAQAQFNFYQHQKKKKCIDPARTDIRGFFPYNL